MKISISESDIVKMYLDDKFSTIQISEKTNISEWKIRHILQKNDVRKRSISEAIIYVNITKFGKHPFSLMEDLSASDEKLKIAGIMLYWGEGSKRGNEVGFTNSDPEMVKVFLLFLRRICGIDEGRLKPMLHLYPDQDKKFIEEFWSLTAGIDKRFFYPSYIHQGKEGTYKNKSRYGTFTVKYCDKRLLRVILGWIDEYKNNLLAIMPE